ncbi:ATP-dependent Clp protease ATP-binding subunit [Rhodococcus triatomae]|uniref:C-terminal, D2-small domain-containing protein, of ClpB protein n=1 Tax=Rhodococcus triatomae TaxID=300028 RepID=A0A1G8MBT8_9NOCA|nr:AAA family ATPase [Rhodococcus triatomae]QNG18139.1 ATP-dependent Clp protease ATP-binding subunit [Rhodococcus triatomae]QNG22191.1 ATP-dependent Clp protease ATP-binding subunit [Rhodococcus triatomae]SDI65406.1 C-terminal, D2-small domain-containing protein, of ClpB protein [Rhodococcus triatomae]
MPYINDRIEQTRRAVADTGDDRPDAPVSRERTQGLADELRQRIVGQDGAVAAVAHAVELGRSGLGEPDRPLSCTLLVGPTGVGKTELVRQVAAALRTGRDDLCRIDMSSLAQEHYMASLSGSPPGYAGSREDFSLFDRSRVEGDPYLPGIVLFDELEKAHSAVLRSLLHVMDHGILRLANGNQTINFRNAHLFFTSNLGARELFAVQRNPLWRMRRAARMRLGRRPGRTSLFDRGPDPSAAIVRRSLERHFDPEFLNRFDDIVAFDALDDESARTVVDLEIDALIRRCARRGITLEVERSVAELVHRRGFDRGYGARSVRRAVRASVATSVAEAAWERRGRTGDPLALRAVVAGEEVVVRAATEP